jgi:hypothetical protein
MRIFRYHGNARLHRDTGKSDTSPGKVANYCRSCPQCGSIEGSTRNHWQPPKESGMKLTFIRKTRESTTGNCPAAYLREDGRYVIQGWKLSDNERAQLRDLGDDETAVAIPADVITGLLAAQ